MSAISRIPIAIQNLLDGRAVPRVRLGDAWLYGAKDVVRLIGDGRTDWQDLKCQAHQLAAIARKVQVAGIDGKWEAVDMLDTEGVLRLVQSIPGHHAERIKAWLAESGQQRLEESADPELAIRRTRMLYEQHGYSKDWIEKRIRSVGARHELTRQWFKRGATESDHYRQLTNELMLGAFGMDVEVYRRYKLLGAESLRDHMDDLELALTTLGETTAAMLHKQRNSQGIAQLQRDVHDAGEIAGRTRQLIEQKLGRAVASGSNYLSAPARRRLSA